MARVLTSDKLPLVYFFHKSAAITSEARMTEAVDKVIETYSFPKEEEIRLLLIRNCLLNFEYLTPPPLPLPPSQYDNRSVLRRSTFIFIILSFAFAFSGKTYFPTLLELILAAALTILLEIYRHKVFWPVIRNEEEKLARREADRPQAANGSSGKQA